MAINFSDKVLVTNPTTFFLGRFVFILGLIAVAFGVITHFTEEVLLPGREWCVFGALGAATGGIMMRAGLTKN